jgi:hypothetical protein
MLYFPIFFIFKLRHGKFYYSYQEQAIFVF